MTQRSGGTMPTGSERLVPPLTAEERAQFEADAVIVRRRLRDVADGGELMRMLGVGDE